MHLFSRPNSIPSATKNSIQEEIIRLIDQSTDSLKVAVTWFTNHDIYNAVLRKLSNPDYDVHLIVLNDRINNKSEGLDFQKLIDNNGKFSYSEIDTMVHHKFCIIDDKTVITGSYNWTYYSENRNWENVLFLSEPETVKAYNEEFCQIIKNNPPITTVGSKRNLKAAVNSIDYLQNDYYFQAKQEKSKGNDLAVAKVYTQLLRIDNKQEKLLAERNEILKKYNRQEVFEVTPFEIGIHYKSGYDMAIPAFTPLPLPAPVVKKGFIIKDKQDSIHVTIQMNDIVPKTILEFDLLNIEPTPEGTEKVHYFLSLDRNGTLTVVAKEVGGFGRVNRGSTNLKNCR